MKTITIKLASDNDAQLLKVMLKTAQFEDEAETIEEDSEEILSDDEILVLNERMAEYKRNPSSGKSMDETLDLLKSKYGI